MAFETGKVEGAILRRAYLWNTMGSFLNAFQSVFMLIIMTRVCDLTTAGVFTLAYANANLFLTMGNFGMRNYEASDVAPRFGFRAYSRSRAITVTAMIVCSWAYLGYSAITIGYSPEKIAAVALMTLFRAVDSLEDVFSGNFQQQGRLDVGARQMTLRIGSTIIVFGLSIAVTRDLVLSTAIATAYGLVFMVSGLAWINRRFDLPAWHREAPEQHARNLLKECLPLFIAAFLLFYVGNAPKYAIDAILDDVAQAQYGFIAMPVFVVGLLAQMIYVPLVEPLSEMWDRGEKAEFLAQFRRQIVIIAIITVVCVAGAWLLGVPVLGWLYNTDLSSFRTELCILVLGGGFLALASLFTMGITVMRQQRKLVWGYVAVAVLAALASPVLVRAFAIAGASYTYIGCMVILAAWFALLFHRCSHRI